MVTAAAGCAALLALGSSGPARAGTTAPAADGGAHGAYSCDNGAAAAPVHLAARQSPPRGFHPLTASDADLKKYGFPKRPGPGSPSAARWKSAMAHWKSFGDQTAAWRCPGVTFGPGGNYTTANNHWAGNEDHASAVGAPHYSGADTDITGPVVSPDFNHCDESHVAAWVGVGEGTSSSDQLVQTGEDVAAACGRGQWTRLFYQVTPYDNPVFVAPFSTGPGDPVYFSVSYDGGSCASFYMENSAGVGGSYSECFSGSSGSSAEWIAEKVTTYPLARWSTWGVNQINFTGSYGYTSDGRTIAAGVPYHESIYMTSWIGPNYSEDASGGAWTDTNIWSSFPVKRYNVQSQ